MSTTKRIAAIALLAGLGLMAGSTPVAAQVVAACGSKPCSATQTATASISVPIVLYMNVTNTSIAFGNATANDFSAGYRDAATSSVVSAGGNVTHSVTLQANAANFTPSNTVTGYTAWNKPATDLHWSTDGFASSNNAASTSATALASGASAGFNASLATISYRMLLDWGNDTPGDYSLGMTYTVAAD